MSSIVPDVSKNKNNKEIHPYTCRTDTLRMSGLSKTFLNQCLKNKAQRSDSDAKKGLL